MEKLGEKEECGFHSKGKPIFALYVYIDFFVVDFLKTYLYCLVGCLSMVVWTHAVLGVLCACVFYFCICSCSAQLSMFYMERQSRNTVVIIIIVIIISLGLGPI